MIQSSIIIKYKFDTFEYVVHFALVNLTVSVYFEFIQNITEKFQNTTDNGLPDNDVISNGLKWITLIEVKVTPSN